MRLVYGTSDGELRITESVIGSDWFVLDPKDHKRDVYTETLGDAIEVCEGFGGTPVTESAIAMAKYIADGDWSRKFDLSEIDTWNEQKVIAYLKEW